MADEIVGDKSEPATPRKRMETREKGSVARSQDLSTALLLIAGFLVIFLMAGYLLDGMSRLSVDILEATGSGRLTMDNVLAYGTAGGLRIVLFLLPIAAVMFASAFLVNMAQVGFLITGDAVMPKLSRMDPIQGFKRIFSRRGVVRLISGIIKLVVVGAILVQGFTALLTPSSPDSILQLLHGEIPQIIELSNEGLFRIGMRASGALLILALLDYLFQRWQFERDIMMSRQEVRDELKRLEGDPKIKERRKRIGQQLALQRMMRDVPKADVVITNPTHVACAIRYEEERMQAPRLVAKGKGFVAHRIRELAIAHSVPVVEEPPLARLIYDATEVGQEIPPDLYQPVAEVLAYVYRLGRRQPQPAEAG